MEKRPRGRHGCAGAGLAQAASPQGGFPSPLTNPGARQMVARAQADAGRPQKDESCTSPAPRHRLLLRALNMSEFPPRALNVSEFPPRALSVSEFPPRALSVSEFPPRALNVSEFPPRALSVSEFPPPAVGPRGSEVPPRRCGLGRPAAEERLRAAGKAQGVPTTPADT